MSWPKSPDCKYIKADGERCGSPAMRHSSYCFQHKRWLRHRRRRHSIIHLENRHPENVNPIPAELPPTLLAKASGGGAPASAPSPAPLLVSAADLNA